MQALLVDDNPTIVSVVGRWLADAGYDTTTSMDFSDAAAELKSHHQDVVVVDVRLGEFNGLQLAIMARRCTPGARIVVISGWDDPVLKNHAAECGAAYLVKPFTSSELLAAITSGTTLTAS